MPQKILITGGSGLLALNWAINFRENFDIVLGLHDRTVNLENTTSCKIQLDSISDISGAFVTVKPDIVINTAGITSVELCEKYPNLAYNVNAQLAVNLAKVCYKMSIKFVHISTDHLFTGNSEYITEEETVNPKNVYGLTKSAAETGVLENNPSALVIRTNFYGWGTSYRHSFSDIILTALRSGKEIKLFSDVFYTPILAETLSDITHLLIDAGAFGIFNVVGNERISKYDFGLRLARCFDLNTKLIYPSLMKNQFALVQRPFDMSLCNSKFSHFLSTIPNTIEQDLTRLCQQEVSGFNSEIIKL